MKTFDVMVIGGSPSGLKIAIDTSSTTACFSKVCSISSDTIAAATDISSALWILWV